MRIFREVSQVLNTFSLKYISLQLLASLLLSTSYSGGNTCKISIYDWDYNIPADQQLKRLNQLANERSFDRILVPKKPGSPKELQEFQKILAEYPKIEMVNMRWGELGKRNFSLKPWLLESNQKIDHWGATDLNLKMPILKMAQSTTGLSGESDDAAFTLANAQLMKIYERIRRPEDPKHISITIKNDKTPNASIVYNGGEYAKIEFTRGLLELAKNEDELAGILGHELGHIGASKRASVKGTYGNAKRTINMPYEEVIVADTEALERLSYGKYNPEAYRDIMIRLKEKGHQLKWLDAFLEDHPDMQTRITKANLWLTENEAKIEFSKLTRLPKEIQDLVKSPIPYPSPIVEKKVAYKPPAPLPKTKDNRTVVQGSEIVAAVENHPLFKALSLEDRAKFWMNMLHDPEYQIRATEELFSIAAGPKTIFKDDKIEIPYFFKQDKKGYSNRESKLVIIEPYKPFHESLTSLNKHPRFPEEKARIFQYFKNQGTNTELQKNFLSWSDLYYPFFNSLNDWKPVSELGKLKEEKDLLVTQRVRNLESILRNTKEPSVIIKLIQEASRTGIPIWFLSKDDLYSKKIDQAMPWAIKNKDVDFLLARNWPSSETSYRGSSSVADEKYSKFVKDRMLYVAKNRDVAPGVRLLALNKANIEFFEKDQHEKILRGLLADFTKPEHLVELLDISKNDYNPRKHELVASVLKNHPEWKFTPEQIDKILSDESAWSKSAASTARIYAEQARDYAGARTGEKLSIREAPSISEVMRTFEMDWNESWALKTEIERRLMFSGKTSQVMDYIPENSDTIQKALIFSIESFDKNRIPNEQSYKDFKRITSRGLTDTTDSLAKQILLHPEFKCEECLLDALREGIVFDLPLRKLIYDRVAPKFDLNLADFELPKPIDGRIKNLISEMALANVAFPESSLQRADAFEQIAKKFRTNLKETRIISDFVGKASENSIGLSLRALNAFNAKLAKVEPGGKKNPLDVNIKLIDYLTGFGPPPTEVESLIRETFGIERTPRYFSFLPNEHKAAILSNYLGSAQEKNTILGEPKYRQLIHDRILSGVNAEHRKTASMFLAAASHAISEKAKFQEPLFYGILLSQRNGNDVHPGEVIRNILSSMGNSGVSIGQKIFQRRLLPDDWLPYLEDLTDQSRNPSRLHVLELLSKSLGVPDLDSIIEVKEVLGNASTKVVVRGKFKDGRVEDLGDRAIKVLWEDLKRTNELESGKLLAMMGFLERNGGQEYRKLRSVLDAVKRGLDDQLDLYQEARNYNQISKLYSNGELSPEGFVFRVVKPDVQESSREGRIGTIVSEQLAEGSSIKSLSDEEKAKVYRAIKEKEERILFANPDENGLIHFEADRHRGNFKVNLSTHPPEIHIFDYPLLRSIHGEDRDAVFKAIAILEGIRTSGNPKVAKHLESELSKLIITKFDDTPLGNVAGKNISSIEFRKVIEGLQSGKTDLVGAFLSALTASEIDGVKVKPVIYDYIISLGHAEHYSMYSPKINGKSSIETKITMRAQRFEAELTSAVVSNLSATERLGYKLMNWSKRVFGKDTSRSPSADKVNSCSALLNLI